MPLNHQIGERIEGMDEIFVVVPTEKYASQSNLTTIIKRVSGGKFKREVEVSVPIFEAAVEHAQKAFIKAGLKPGSDIDILCQEYPSENVVVFVFSAAINGVENLVTAPFKLSDAQIAELTVRGLWKPLRLN